MTFNELLMKRRSVRNFLEKPVPTEVVRELIADSTLAPNAGNEQPWKFIIVQDKGMMRRISEESKNNILTRISGNPNDYAKKYQRMLENESYNVFYNAPCLVLIMGHSQLKNLLVDCSLAACYFMLAAASRGLGTCWVNFGTELYDADLRNELRIPHDGRIVAPIILGYPEKVPPVPKRKQPEILNIIEPMPVVVDVEVSP